MHQGALYAMAFGRFDDPRGWVAHQSEGPGILFHVETGRDDAAGHRVRRVALRDWVRGLAIADQHILVGESVNRQLTSDVRGAAVAVLDRRTWEVRKRLMLPFREVYDLVLATPRSLEGILRSPSQVCGAVPSTDPHLLIV